MFCQLLDVFMLKMLNVNQETNSSNLLKNSFLSADRSSVVPFSYIRMSIFEYSPSFWVVELQTKRQKLAEPTVLHGTTDRKE